MCKHGKRPARLVPIHVAPAVRIAPGEEFGLEPATAVSGPTVAALKQLASS